MSQHFLRQIERVKERILELGGKVERMVEHALAAVKDRDLDLARRVVESEPEIDHLEVEVEEECLHTLALYQPVAGDLRFIISVVKINAILERIGDLAVHLAEKAIQLAQEPDLNYPLDLHGESRRVRQMLKWSLDALVAGDVRLAQRVRAADDEVDSIHREATRAIAEEMQRDPGDAERLLELLGVSRHLERIADHAVEIAEHVIFSVQGDVLRHEVSLDLDAEAVV
jgi:phosphate transport system protein